MMRITSKINYNKMSPHENETFKSAYSETLLTTDGVPQGTVLGPLLVYDLYD